ncbi:hypothetical protein C8J57DRAFT_1169318 [Mycena rebaudengoi]|nr:hypothetical protein C8J57DRAFT_1169318 [Mycena rebaudengoi]
MFAPSPSSSSSSSGSSRSSPVHPASLVDAATHSPALMELVDLPLSRPVIEYVVDIVAETVDYAMGRPVPSPSARGRSHTRTRSAHLHKFTSFASTVLSRAEVSAPVVLASLVYIQRAKPHLHIALEEWALERVFLGALICASKYLNDSTLKNVHWALCTGVFGKRDVGRIEREFLDVLDWELGVCEADLVAHHEGLVAAAFPHRSVGSTTHTSKRHSIVLDELDMDMDMDAYLVPRHHTHGHKRRLSANVPDLTPSSPHSAASSMSPRTPLSLSSSSSSTSSSASNSHSGSPAMVDVPMDVESHSLPAPPPMATSASGKSSMLHDLLRAFPAPARTCAAGVRNTRRGVVGYYCYLLVRLP